jgi:hypothetical protein
VFVVGGKAFTSTILQQNCHEFVSYESLLNDDIAPAALPVPLLTKRRARRTAVRSARTQRSR